MCAGPRDKHTHKHTRRIINAIPCNLENLIQQINVINDFNIFE